MRWPFRKKEVISSVSSVSPARKTSEIPVVDGPAESISIGAGTGGLADPKVDVLTASQIQTYYIRNAWVRKYINVLVTSAIKYQLRAVPVKGSQNDELAKKNAATVNQLLKFANKREPFSDVREKYLRDLFLHSNGAIEIAPRDAKTKVDALYAAPGYALILNADDSGNITDDSAAYYFRDPNTNEVIKTKPYPINSIIHLKLDQLSDRIYGLSRLDSVSDELESDIQSTSDIKRGTADVPQQVITFPKTHSGFVDKVTLRLQALISGKVGDRIAAVNVEGSQIKLSTKTFADELELQKWLVQRHNVFGIPPFKLGFVAQVGSMSSREQREEFQSFIETIVTYEAAMLTLVLVQKRLSFDNVEIVSPQIVTRLDFEKTRVVERLVGANIITPNEARTIYLGLDPHEDPQADELQFKV